MGRVEATFFFLWGVATLVTSLVVYFAQGYLSSVGMFWGLVPFLGLTGSYFLVRYYRRRGRIFFGETRHAIAATWSILGPTIGLVGFDSPTPLVGKLVVLGAGVAVTGGLLRHRPTLWVGVFCALSSLLLRQISLTLQPVIFGVVTFVSMTIPSLLLLFRSMLGLQQIPPSR